MLIIIMDIIKMSINKFHVIFISICSTFMVYFAYWSYTSWKYYDDKSYISYLVISIISLLVLIIYSQKFTNKYKGLTS